ncbi:MAG: SRPBCC family protein [Pyrinomonadaceae bacterium]|nr:SRPBCC family protein [Pyrinomonadaceae bacterium]
MPEYYEFVTIWRFDAPLEKVWETIKHSEHWHEWWQGVIRVVELKEGDKNGLGSIRRSTWKSKLPYKLEFDSEIVRLEPMNIIEARAFGELDGIGLWTLTAENENITHVRYDWKVKTTKAWMNLLAPVAKPFFRWNHNVIMNWGGEGLASKLGCQLLESKEG